MVCLVVDCWSLLAMLAGGMTVDEIAACNQITVRQVRFKLAKVRSFLGARSNCQAVALAVQWGYVLAAAESETFDDGEFLPSDVGE